MISLRPDGNHIILTHLFPEDDPFSQLAIETIHKNDSGYSVKIPLQSFPEVMNELQGHDYNIDELRQVVIAFNKLPRVIEEPEITTRIEINNQWINIYTDDPDFPAERIKKEFFYFVEGYQHTKAFDKGTWDGKRYLFRWHNDHYFCRAGLWNRLKLILDITKTRYALTDHRRYDGFQQLDYSWNYDRDLWDHQLEALKICQEKASGIIRIPTGGGKSVVMARLVSVYGLTANIFIDRVDVGYQLQKTFQKCLKEKIGFIGNGNENWDPAPNINIILLPTAYLALTATGKLKKWEKDPITDEYKLKEITLDPVKYSQVVSLIEQADLNLYDECSSLGAKTNSAVSSCTKGIFSHGFDATPWRNDGADLEIEGAIGPVIYSKTTTELTERDILVPADIRIFQSPPLLYSLGNLKGVNGYKKAYRKAIVENEGRNKLICDNTEEMVKTEGLIGLISVAWKDHGTILREMLKQRGMKAEFIHGTHKQGTREKALAALKERNLDVIISTLFGRGTDIPELEFLIRAKAGGYAEHINKPHTDVIQMTGRVLRSSPGKEKGIIIDYFDPYPMLDRHSRSRIEAYESEKAWKMRYYRNDA